MDGITLCCGHVVGDMSHAVSLEVFEDGNRFHYGQYCKDCANKLIAEGRAKVYQYPQDWMNYTGDMPEEVDELVELVKAIRNRCNIFLLIASTPCTSHLWPTLLEDLGEDAIEVLESFCVDGD